MVETPEYLKLLSSALDSAFNEFKPEFILYNAGTDILERGTSEIMCYNLRGISNTLSCIYTLTMDMF
jgi:acetoin utilization deacetylase AcuC-like enzyme